MAAVARQVLIDAFGCNPDLLNDADWLERLMLQAAATMETEVLDAYVHQFEPQGVTVAVVTAGSNLTIHTWPEHGYVAADLFHRNDFDLADVVDQILTALQAETSMVTEQVRGNRSVTMYELE